MKNKYENYYILKTIYTNKGYFEHYAIFILRTINNEYSNLFHYTGQGSPDWQDTNGNLSVEVTRAINKDERDYLAFVSEYFSHMDLFLKLKIDEQNYWLSRFGLNIYNGCFMETASTYSLIFKNHDPIKAVLYSVDYKLNKLNNGSFNLHKNNHLFIFCDTISENFDYLENEINNLYIKWNKHFDKIYICFDDILLFYQNKKISYKQLTLDVLSKAKQYGKDNCSEF